MVLFRVFPDNGDSHDVGLDALGRITRFEYDSQGRQTARILPLGQREEMAYNAAGELIEKRTFNGEVIAMSYDLAGRLDEITLPDRTRTFAYTPSGQVKEIVDGSDTWRFDYDARDRLIRAQDSAGRVIAYAYDAAGNRTELSTCASAGSCSGGQQVAYAYDALNRLREVVAQLPGSAPQTTEYRYDALGARSGMTHPNGTVVEYRYDLRHRLQTLVHRASAAAGAAVLLALSYTVDASGLRTQIAESRPGDASTPTFTRTTDYAYDAVKRLVREEVSGNHGNPERVHAWTYDAVGNRLSQVATIGTGSSAATTTTSYAYDANDRLQTESAVTGSAAPVVTTSEYDNAGNLTETRIGANTEARYTWDAEGRLACAILGHGAAQKTIAYRYDPNGIRRSQQMTETSGAVTRTEYLVDPNQAYAQVLEEWTASATSGPLPDETLATTYVYGDDLISQTQLALAGTSATSIYHYDGLGTTRALSAHKVDATGSPQAGHGEITDRYAYTAFGELDPAGTSGDTSGATDNNYRYTGEQLDPNLGFYYLRARYMDPSQARFLGMDIFEGSGRDPGSLHRYVYAHAGPTMNIDPSGKVTLREMSLTVQLAFRNTIHVSVRYGARFVSRAKNVMLRTLAGAKQRIRQCLRNREKCDLDTPVHLEGNETAETSQHVFDAQLGAGSNIVPSGVFFNYIRPGHSRGWLKSTGECNESARVGYALSNGGSRGACDEFPYRVTKQGGQGNHPLRVSLRLTPTDEAGRQGTRLSAFLRRCGITPNHPKKSQFIVLGVPDIPGSFFTPPFNCFDSR